MPNPSDGPSDEAVERAAWAICVGRSDDWGNPDDRENSRADALAALEAASPVMAEMEAVVEAAREADKGWGPGIRPLEAWDKCMVELHLRLGDLDRSLATLTPKEGEG